jgi:heptose I phosphotransferase
MQLELASPFKEIWQDKDPFKVVETLEGKVYRQLEARKTLSFECHGNSYFIKIHRGVGWFEIIENLLRLRLPVLGARNEYLAIHKLESLHVDTMKIAGYGIKGWNPATQHSFIITEDLINTISLEDFCAPWKNQRPDFALKINLIRKVAWVSRILHENGINHRDYYICHFLLDVSQQPLNYEQLKISLIDLHRAQIRSRTPLRWRVKDIASLYFSAMDIGLTQRDFYRFMKLYQQKGLRDCLQDKEGFWGRVARQGNKLWLRKERKGDAIA